MYGSDTWVLKHIDKAIVHSLRRGRDKNEATNISH